MKRNKGRLGPFVPLIKSTLASPAWRAMSHGARSLYVALKSRYNSKLQNGVYLSAREGADEIGSNKSYVARWHHELEHYGFIRMVTPHALGVYGLGKAAHYRLTEEWHDGQPPTRDFQQWDGRRFRYVRKKQKQKPVPQTGDTMSYKVGTVAKPNGSPRAESVPQTGDIQTPSPVLQTGDITSLTTPQPCLAVPLIPDDLSIPTFGSRRMKDRARMLVIASLPREGRVMRQVRRSFVAAGGKPLSTSQIMPWAYPELARFNHWHRWSVRRALLRCAVPIGRADCRGRPVIWQPNL